MPPKKSNKKRSVTKTERTGTRPDLFINTGHRANSRYRFDRGRGRWIINPELLNVANYWEPGCDPNKGDGLIKTEIKALANRLTSLAERILKRFSRAGGRPPKYDFELRAYRDALAKGLKGTPAWKHVYQTRKVQARLAKLPFAEQSSEKQRIRQAVVKRLKRLIVKRSKRLS